MMWSQPKLPWSVSYLTRSKEVRTLTVPNVVNGIPVLERINYLSNNVLCTLRGIIDGD